MTMEPLILPPVPGLRGIDVYEAHGGYGMLRKAIAMKPEEVTDEVKKSGLRGRGGACFPTGLKWTFMPKQTDKQKYLCVNGDESEPGTFKDRQIFELNPHLLIEGAVIAAYAMGVGTIYLYIRGEYNKWIAMVQKAVDEAYARGYCGESILGSAFSTSFTVHRGAGAYICGEESSLMNSIEGERGYPRVKPPFPAQFGLWGCPTTINNGTLALQDAAAYCSPIAIGGNTTLKNIVSSGTSRRLSQTSVISSSTPMPFMSSAPRPQT